jgi:hypothetical protein
VARKAKLGPRVGRTGGNHAEVERRDVHLVLDRDALGGDERVERLLDELGQVVRQMPVRRALHVVVDGVCAWGDEGSVGQAQEEVGPENALCDSRR